MAVCIAVTASLAHKFSVLRNSARDLDDLRRGTFSELGSETNRPTLVAAEEAETDGFLRDLRDKLPEIAGGGGGGGQTQFCAGEFAKLT